MKGGLGVRQRRQHAFVIKDVGRSSEQKKKTKGKALQDKMSANGRWGMKKKKLSFSPPLFPQRRIVPKMTIFNNVRQVHARPRSNKLEKKRLPNEQDLAGVICRLCFSAAAGTQNERFPAVS